MKVQALEEIVDDPGPIAVTIDVVQDIVCCLHRQRGDLQSFAVWGDIGYVGCDTKANVMELTQLLHHCVDLSGVGPLRVKNGFGVVEDYKHFPGGVMDMVIFKAIFFELLVFFMFTILTLHFAC